MYFLLYSHPSFIHYSFQKYGKFHHRQHCTAVACTSNADMIDDFLNSIATSPLGAQSTPGQAQQDPSPLFSTSHKDDLPHVEIPNLITKGPNFVGIDLQVLQKHFPYFNFFRFQKHLAKIPLAVSTTTQLTSNPNLMTPSPDLLEYHIQHYFFFLCLHRS